MTEIEKIEYAKSFIDKLANGINPLDGSTIKEDDIVNNVRISRCFFFVSDILRQVIENRTTPPERAVTKQFSLTADQLKRFAYSEQPIPISEIAKRINALIEDASMKKITHKDLTNWLISVGLLIETVNADGRTRKYPTEQGKAVGISTELRSGAAGTYSIIIYRKEAQALLIDHLDVITELKYSK